jgi:integrating conjugative element protein (TIGR03759 family)
MQARNARLTLVLLSAFCTPLLLAPVVLAQPAPAPASRPVQSSIQTTPSQTSAAQNSTAQTTQAQGLAWRQYGLTEADWQRYQDLLSSPQAYWSEDKRPLIVLGVTARTEEERRRYAELYVNFEYQAAQGTFAFSRMVDAIGKAKHGTEALFGAVAQAQAPEMFEAGDRMMLVLRVDQECLVCTQAISVVQQIGRSNGTTGVDVYFVGATREAIVAYGSQRMILPEDVKAKRITLNIATPEFLAQMKLNSGSTPSVFRRRGQALTPIALSELAQLRMRLPL